MELKITPLTARIGAEIGGVDLSRPMAPEALEGLRRAIAEHQVIFFRDQTLDPDSLKAFGRGFGELVLHSAVPGLADHPEVVAIHSDANSKYVAGDDWHSDLTCDAAPPMGSILYLSIVPGVGGDTLFSSMTAAFSALSPRLQAYLDGLQAEHDADHVYRPLFPDVDRKYPCSNHPVVRTHPVTGKKGLFVNSSYTTKILGLPAAESEAMLAFLYGHMADPAFTCRFRWREGSVAFWDNRCTQHRAIWDYYPQTRSGIRVTIGGDKPF